jgi:methylisocitrate lyase
MTTTPGKKFHEALRQENPLQIIGTLNAYVALMAKQVGYKALYLSGAGVANSAYGIPDLAMTTMDNVLIEVNRITEAVDLPLLVDIDTGWGNVLTIERCIKLMERAGAAGVHIEDQVYNKRCGHLMDKELVPLDEMVSRIKTAVNAKTDCDFVIMARTDAYAVEGLDKTLERALAYKAAGADMLFPEALISLEDYKKVKEAVGIPTLANLTEFGQTPLFTLSELAWAKIDMALYPLSVNRAMNQVAHQVLKTIKKEGTQQSCLKSMQTRQELYEILKYDSYKEKLL